ncbi:DUF551 domain-containing protein [Enterobacter hormaechei]|uniref:DUF551 domain-containing protein n=1 Tax=Enterobacter hormaechei TaxID=158836 RepID=UPI003906008D
MSTITKEFTKEQLQQIEAAAKEVMWPVVWSEKKAREHFSEKITPKVVLKLARIALASLEAEAVCVIDQSNLDYLKSGSDADVWPASRTEMGDVLLYRSATPAPVSVPDAIHSQGEKSASDDYYALGWNACRAAMLKHSEPFIVTSDHRMMEMPQVEAINAVTAILQGADGTLTNEGTIPVTQFKPVADLYGLTSPTGGETSFTFDAVEARDFIDGGWSCQEYVELERFQEAVSGNSPVIPDGWVACGEQMPEDEQEVIVQNKMGYRYVSYFDEHSGLFFDMRGGNQMNCIEHIFVTHWMPMPAAPQQEVKP